METGIRPIQLPLLFLHIQANEERKIELERSFETLQTAYLSLIEGMNSMREKLHGILSHFSPKMPILDELYIPKQYLPENVPSTNGSGQFMVVPGERGMNSTTVIHEMSQHPERSQPLINQKGTLQTERDSLTRELARLGDTTHLEAFMREWQNLDRRRPASQFLTLASGTLEKIKTDKGVLAIKRQDLLSIMRGENTLYGIALRHRILEKQMETLYGIKKIMESIIEYLEASPKRRLQELPARIDEEQAALYKLDRKKSDASKKAKKEAHNGKRTGNAMNDLHASERMSGKCLSTLHQYFNEIAALQKGIAIGDPSLLYGEEEVRNLGDELRTVLGKHSLSPTVSEESILELATENHEQHFQSIVKAKVQLLEETMEPILDRLSHTVIEAVKCARHSKDLTEEQLQEVVRVAQQVIYEEGVEFLAYQPFAVLSPLTKRLIHCHSSSHREKMNRYESFCKNSLKGIRKKRSYRSRVYTLNNDLHTSDQLALEAWHPAYKLLGYGIALTQCREDIRSLLCDLDTTLSSMTLTCSVRDEDYFLSPMFSTFRLRMVEQGGGKFHALSPTRTIPTQDLDRLNHS